MKIFNFVRLTKLAREFYELHEKKVDLGFFVGGFIFDILTLGQVEDWTNMLQQTIYLSILAFFIGVELRKETDAIEIPSFLNPIWNYHRLIIHFMLGSLLSVYTLFFFKSGSIVSSFIFIGVIVSAMVLNEFPQVQHLGGAVRAGLYTLCLNCFFALHVPLLFGHIGFIPFLTSCLFSALTIYALFVWIKRGTPPLQRNWTYIKTEPVILKFIGPAATTLSLFLILYILKILPPVPVAIKEIGVYHNIQKQSGEWILTYTRPSWKFWQKGDQDFGHQEGDQVYCFVNIYSPTNFSDQVSLNWYKQTSFFNWELTDSIPLSIHGKRAEGYRGYGFKQNFTPGDWQVRVVTVDGREVGRLSFSIIPEEAGSFREYSTEIH